MDCNLFELLFLQLASARPGRREGSMFDKCAAVVAVGIGAQGRAVRPTILHAVEVNVQDRAVSRASSFGVCYRTAYRPLSCLPGVRLPADCYPASERALLRPRGGPDARTVCRPLFHLPGNPLSSTQQVNVRLVVRAGPTPRSACSSSAVSSIRCLLPSQCPSTSDRPPWSLSDSPGLPTADCLCTPPWGPLAGAAFSS